MSNFKVPVTTIKDILEHPNAHSLSIAKVYDFNVVVRKNSYKTGDVILFIPIDSVIPEWLETKLFPADSKIKLHNRRVKQIKIRSFPSQGMVVDLEDLPQTGYVIESDYSESLGITKYEPPAANYQQGSVKKRDKPKENPFFHKYGGIDNAKWYPDLFQEGEMVSVTEKIHGSNIRFGYVPYVANNLWRKILKVLGLTPAYEWVYGSNNVQLQQRSSYTGFYEENVYYKVLEKYDAKNKCKPGEIWYGELYGSGIQKGYEYGCEEGEHRLIVFDLKLQDGKESKYVDAKDFRVFATNRGFELPPELYCGPFNKENIQIFTKGNSVLESKQKVREGIVIKPLIETECSMGRKLLKMISEKYLESDQTEFH